MPPASNRPTTAIESDPDGKSRSQPNALKRELPMQCVGAGLWQPKQWLAYSSRHESGSRHPEGGLRSRESPGRIERETIHACSRTLSALPRAFVATQPD